MISAILFSLLSSPAEAGGEFQLFFADGQQAEFVAWNADESGFALRVYDTRSDAYAAANTRLPSGCAGYTLAGMPFNGGANVVLYSNMNVTSKYPLYDGNRCTDPGNVQSRQENINVQLQGQGISVAGSDMPLQSSSTGDVYYDYQNERFKFYFDPPTQEGDLWTLSTRVRTKYDSLTITHSVKSASAPTWGIDKAIVSPSGNKVLLIGWYQMSTHRAVGPLLALHKGSSGRWELWPPQ